MKRVFGLLLIFLIFSPSFGKDLYDILNVPEPKEEASEREIRSQYRKLSRQYHPDVNASSNAKEIYAEIQHAYDVLSDRRKRKIYDMKGKEGLEQLESFDRQKNEQGQHPFFSFFQSNAHAQDRHLTLSVALELVYNGHAQNVSMSKLKLCKACKATGAKDPNKLIPCTACQAKGVVIKQIQIFPGFTQRVQQTCDVCRGTGRTYANVCPICKGQRRINHQYQLEVELERGLPDGYQLRFELEGDQSPEHIPGDVVFHVKTVKHPYFRRDGNNLHVKMRISLRDALLGVEREILHLDRRKVLLSVPYVKRHGEIHILEGEGMPIHNSAGEFGDLIIKFSIDFPTNLSPQQRQRLGKALDEALYNSEISSNDL